MIEFWFLPSTPLLMTFYPCIKFYLIPSYTFRDMLRTTNYRELKKGSNSVNTVGRVMILAPCTFSDGPVSMYQFSFNSLIYFQRYAADKLFIAKIIKASNFIYNVDRVTILALCTFPYYLLSMYQVSFNSLVYFLRDSPDKLCIASIKREVTP